MVAARHGHIGGANGSYRHGNDHLIELRAVLKVYESAAGTFTALKSVDLEIGRGEFVAIIGKSGSGKSTLINMITGIDRPTSGEVLVGDTAVHTLSEGQMASWRGRACRYLALAVAALWCACSTRVGRLDRTA